MLIVLLKYLRFCDVVHMLSRGIRTGLCFISIAILTGISSANYMTLIGTTKVYIRNADEVARRLGPASTKATNLWLEVAREEAWKKQEVVERRKAEAVAAKWWRDRRGLSLSSEDDEDHSHTYDTDPDQEDNFNPVLFWLCCLLYASINCEIGAPGGPLLFITESESIDRLLKLVFVICITS